MGGMGMLQMEHHRTAIHALALEGHLLPTNLPQPVNLIVMVFQPVLTALKVTRDGTVDFVWMDTLDSQWYVAQDNEIVFL